MAHKSNAMPGAVVVNKSAESSAEVETFVIKDRNQSRSEPLTSHSHPHPPIGPSGSE